MIAAGSSSWCKETNEKINYTKLCRLLVDGGTQAVRSVFDGIRPPSSLTAILNANKTTLQKLKKPKGKVLNNEQWDKLYPPSGINPTSKDFDITLLFVLIRNICGLTPPPATGWDVLPPITDNSLEANLARIKYYRNNTIAHKSNTEINDVDFEQYWQDISSALLSLGLNQEDIDDLKSARLGEKNYNQLLYDWYISDEDIKTQLEDLKSNTTDIKDGISELRNICTSTYQQNQHVDKLAKSEFSSLIKSSCKSFHPNTRQWILDQVNSHVDSDQPESCIMQITAGPGMGKSTIAAKICETYKNLGCLGGCHFFQFSDSTRNNPRLMLQSIASQMCETVPGYRDSLGKKLQTDLGKEITKMDCDELFTVLFEEPLHNTKCEYSTRNTFVVVLDAIDECCGNLKHELQEILRGKLSQLSLTWLRFVITTRPPPSFSAFVSAKNNVVIDPKSQQNELDLVTFFTDKLELLCGDTDGHSTAIEGLVKTSGGLFLVAFFVIDHMQKENITSPSEVMGIFPNGISSVYEKYFKRVKTVLLPYISEEERFYVMLEAIVATQDPIPIDMMKRILCLKSEREVPRKERMSRKYALSSFHSLFPVENDHVTVFHKSVVDWLILEGEEEHEFSVPLEDENRELDVLTDTQSKKRILDEPLYPNGREKYAKTEDDFNVGVEDDSEVLDVLHDTRSEKRNMDKPLDPTDSEKHANKAHEFSVRLVHADEVLENECHDVLSDILNGKKDLNKPFTPTASEKYALRLGWDFFEGSSKTNVYKKYGKLRNYFNLTATICSLNYEEASIGYPSGLSENLCSIIFNGVNIFSQRNHDESSCPLRQPANFGRCVEFVLNAANTMKVSEEEIGPNPLELLRKHKLSYFERKSIAVNFKEDLSERSVTPILPCENGFIVSHYSKGYTDVQKYQLDGTCSTKKSYPGARRMCMSPDHRFIVATEEKEKGDIELIDATTLELVTSYPSPNVIRSCHVFGDQPWYIVARCYNNKIYVMEGETGQVHSTPTSVDQHVDVDAVSVSGDILLSTTWESTDKRDGDALFTDEDGTFLEKMNWRGKEAYPLMLAGPGHILYRKLSLCHFTKIEKDVPIYPLKVKCCSCIRRGFHENNGTAVLFSNDGSLLAYRYKGSIFIIQTSNGSLYKQVFLGPDFFISKCIDLRDYVLFLSDTYVVIYHLSMIMFINIQTNEIENRFLFPEEPKDLYVLPRKQGEPFTLLTDYNNSDKCVSQYKFHNLDL